MIVERDGKNHLLLGTNPKNDTVTCMNHFPFEVMEDRDRTFVSH